MTDPVALSLYQLTAELRSEARELQQPYENERNHRLGALILEAIERLIQQDTSHAK